MATSNFRVRFVLPGAVVSHAQAESFKAACKAAEKLKPEACLADVEELREGHWFLMARKVRGGKLEVLT